MEFDDLWLIIEAKNSNLKNNKEVRMTINGFKKAVKLGYDKGYQAGVDSKSMFDNIFGN